MKTVSSEEFIVPYVDEIAIVRVSESAAKQLAEIPLGIVDHMAIKITIAAVVPDGAKVTKDIVQAFFRSTVSKSEVKVWEDKKKKFRFDFGKDEYRWGDREIYLSTAERLLLFRILILEEKFYGHDRATALHTIRAIRYRFEGNFPEIKI